MVVTMKMVETVHAHVYYRVTNDSEAERAAAAIVVEASVAAVLVATAMAKAIAAAVKALKAAKAPSERGASSTRTSSIATMLDSCRCTSNETGSGKDDPSPPSEPPASPPPRAIC